MRKLFCLALIVLASLVAAACNPYGTSPKAEQAVVQIHALYNSSDFEAVYESSSQQFQEAQTYSEVADFLQNLRVTLGPVVSTEKTSNMVKTSLLLESTVTLGYATRYEHGYANETFAFRLTDGEAILQGWSIVPAHQP